MLKNFQNLAGPLARVSLILAISTSAFGSETQKHSEHAKSLNPHVHGKAELHIVLDDNQLSVELHSPAMNLLGFEHDIQSSEDQKKVEYTRTRLENPNALFLFNDGECVPKQQSADFSDTHSHNDIEATYLYVCEKPDSLHLAKIFLLDVFPNITSLQVQWIIHNRQGETTLNHEHNEINFR
jgi:hypothetical protein